ncbi:MAG: hypothetical protein EOM36_10070 [Bacteroidia bacterium]|nr:hypothetical protein [Bacteroidia bacterium]
MPVIRMLIYTIAFTGAVGVAIHELADGDGEKMLNIYATLFIASAILMFAYVIAGGVESGL